MTRLSRNSRRAATILALAAGFVGAFLVVRCRAEAPGEEAVSAARPGPRTTPGEPLEGAEAEPRLEGPAVGESARAAADAAGGEALERLPEDAAAASEDDGYMSAPRLWFGRLLAPSSPGITGEEPVVGADAGVAFWRRSTAQPFPSDGAWFARGTSGVDGLLRIELPSIQKARALNAELLVEVPMVGWAAVPFDWLATTPAAAQEIRLEAPARVVVHVRDHDQEPVPGVVAELTGRFRIKSAKTWLGFPARTWDTERLWSGVSDEAGDVFFSTAPAGRELSLRLLHGGAEVWNEAGAAFARPGEVLHLGVRIDVAVQGRVHGTVLTYTGEPCKGYRVAAGLPPGAPYADDLLQPISSNRFSFHTETDEEGRYALDVPLHGRVTIAIQSGDRPRSQRRRTVWLTAASRQREVSFVVSPDRNVAGNLYGPDGELVAGAFVRLARPAHAGGGIVPNAALSVRTNDRGAFRFTDVPGGPLVADVESDVGLLPEPVRVGPGRLELHLLATGSATFRIEPSHGTDQGDSANIHLYDAAGVLIRRGVATIGDEQTISGVPPGLYTLVASQEPANREAHVGRLDDLLVPATGEQPLRSLELAPTPRSRLRLIRRGNRTEPRTITLNHDHTLETRQVTLSRYGSTILDLDAGLWELRWRSAKGTNRALTLTLGANEERELEDAFE